jgi:predicted aspartyl protease
MRRNTSRFIAAALVGLAGWTSSSFGADRCTLKQVAAVPAILSANNRLLINATINGQAVWIQVDTGASVSILSKEFVKRMGMPIVTSRSTFYGLTGRGINEQTRVAKLQLGNTTSNNALFVVAPLGDDGPDSEPVGLFGSDYLQNYDVEIDVAGGKVVLFSPDHCPGTLVYWAPEFFKSNIYYGDSGPVHRPMLDVVVDGKKLRALLDTGAFMSVMRLAVAEDRFDLSLDSPDMQKIGETIGVEGLKIATYAHDFQSMTFGDITLHHPKLLIAPIDSGTRTPNIGSHIRSEAGNVEDLLVGMSLMKRLHLVIAYSENAIYYTIATPPKQAANP